MAIGRALMARPTLLLLDEPTSGLDERAMERVLGFVRMLGAGDLNLLVVEHNMKVVSALAHAIDDEGKVIAEGPFAEDSTATATHRDSTSGPVAGRRSRRGDMFLELHQLRADYGGHLALDGVSLSAAQGEILLVAGHNGAGKSTLLKSIVGMVPLRAGRVLLEDRDLTRLPTYERLALGIALVPQGRGSFPNLTVAENLALAGSRGTVTRVPLQARLDQVFQLFPALPAFRERLAGRLSGGQQQMLAIGMTLMKQPRLLLLDEPSVGLAPRLVEEIFDLVARIRDEQRIATVLVEQNVGQAARICDRIVILNAGGMVKDLRPAELTDAILWETF